MSEQTKAAVPLTITPEAAEFLRKHEIEEAFRMSCEWVREGFPELLRLHVLLENDRDEPGWQYVVLEGTLPRDYPFEQLNKQTHQLSLRRAEQLSAATRELICHEFPFASE